MKPTEYNGPLQDGDQSSSEQQSGNEDGDNTQVTQSDSPGAAPEEGAAAPTQQSPQPQGVQLPPYSPSPNEERALFPGRMVFLAPPSYEEIASLSDTRPGPAEERRLIRIGGGGQNRIFISNTRANNDEDREEPDPRRLLMQDTGADNEEDTTETGNRPHRGYDPLVVEGVYTSLSTRRSRRSVILRGARGLCWQTFLMALQALFYLTTALLLLDSTLTELDIVQIADKVRDGSLNETAFCNATARADPLNGPASISLGAAARGESNIAWILFVLKLICFPALMAMLLMPVLCPGDTTRRNPNRRDPNRLENSSDGQMELESLSLEEVSVQEQPQNQADNQQEGEPGDAPSGQLEGASSSQSQPQSRGRN